MYLLLLVLSATRTTLLPVYATTASTEPLACYTPVPSPCPMAAEPQVGVSTVRFERLLHVLLIMWR